MPDPTPADDVAGAVERLRYAVAMRSKGGLNEPHPHDVRLVLDHLADVEARADAAEAALRHARDYCARPAGVCIPKEADRAR